MTKEYTYDDLNNIKPTPHFQYNCIDAREYFSNDMKSIIMDHVNHEKWTSWNKHFDARLQVLEDVIESAVWASINDSEKDEDIEWCKIVSKIVTTYIRKTYDKKNTTCIMRQKYKDVLNRIFIIYILNGKMQAMPFNKTKRFKNIFL